MYHNIFRQRDPISRFIYLNCQRESTAKYKFLLKSITENHKFLNYRETSSVKHNKLKIEKENFSELIVFQALESILHGGEVKKTTREIKT